MTQTCTPSFITEEEQEQAVYSVLTIKPTQAALTTECCYRSNELYAVTSVTKALHTFGAHTQVFSLIVPD